MTSKAVFLCAFGFLVQSIAGQSCYRPTPKPNCGCGSGRVSVIVSEEGSGQSCYQPSSSNRVSIGISEGSGYQSIVPSVSIPVPDNGGAFTVSCIGPISPAGIAVATDLGLSGDLVLSGVLPYLSAVAFEGQFETSGAAPVSYGCGDDIAIIEQIGGNAGSGSLSLNLGGCGCKH